MSLPALLRAAWRFLRDWSGDSAYDRYLERAGDGPRLGREEFFLDSLRRRYSRPSHCC
jgi:uncharacterized short protein YbdD (DUF466 family)